MIKNVAIIQNIQAKILYLVNLIDIEYGTLTSV